MSKRHFIIPIFVPHLGCPHDCVFCNQIRITGLSTDVTPEYVENTIEEYLATFPKDNTTIEVAFYGGSFTGIDQEVQKELLSIPLKYKNKNKINAIRLSTRPDYINEEILELLKAYKVDTIELGVQSLEDEVLDKSGRGHNSEDVYVACDLIKKYKFNLGLQMMIGLVGDNKEATMFTAKKFVKLDPYCVRIYPTLIIKDTYLEKLYEDGLYKPLTLEEAVDITTDLLMLFEHFKINVIRVGLQPTENIQLGEDVISGPFHPSFRQLVESNIYKIIINDYLETIDENILKDKIMIININGKNISNLVGQKSRNVKYLIDKYNFKDIKIYEENLSLEDINISIDGSLKNINKRKVREEYLKTKRII